MTEIMARLLPERSALISIKNETPALSDKIVQYSKRILKFMKNVNKLRSPDGGHAAREAGIIHIAARRLNSALQ